MRVVVLGGSGVATPELARAIAAMPGRTRPVELVLVGRNPEKLAVVAGAARLLAGEDRFLSISHTTDVDAALAGADCVLNQMRVGGLEARASDETFPRELGLPPDETVGAGGFASAVRAIPVILEYARRVERIAPGAVFLTFANPASMVQYAISQHTRLRTVGFCDVPVTLAERIAGALGAPTAELTVDYVGMHHFGWVTGVRRLGRDLLPEALAKAGEIVKEVDSSIAQAVGAIPSPYLKYVFHPERMLAQSLARSTTRAAELLELQAEILTDYERALATGVRPTAQERRGAIWYRAIVAPVLVALAEGRPGRFILNVPNGQAVPWLPPEAIVEVPSLLADGEAQPLATGSVPPEVRALVEANCVYEMLAARAIVERDRAMALRALLISPFKHTYDQAVGVLERAWHSCSL